MNLVDFSILCINEVIFGFSLKNHQIFISIFGNCSDRATRIFMLFVRIFSLNSRNLTLYCLLYLCNICDAQLYSSHSRWYPFPAVVLFSWSYRTLVFCHIYEYSWHDPKNVMSIFVCRLSITNDIICMFRKSRCIRSICHVFGTLVAFVTCFIQPRFKSKPDLFKL
jgi:hypothetical protein